MLHVPCSDLAQRGASELEKLGPFELGLAESNAAYLADKIRQSVQPAILPALLEKIAIILNEVD